MDTSDRISRYGAFKSFMESAKGSLEEISESDEKIKILKSYYGLGICPGGSMGGANDRLFEIFYGQRPFDTQRPNPFNRESIKVLTEYGARLHYNLLDNGAVIAVLYPAKTENYSPIEDAIILSSNLNPHILNKAYKSHFSLLNSYMRCTSLDGTPSIIDTVRVGWLKFTHPLVIDSKKQNILAITHTLEVCKFALSVGLSGFLLAAIMAKFSAPTPDYTNVLMKINQTTEAINSQLGKALGITTHEQDTRKKQLSDSQPTRVRHQNADFAFLVKPLPCESTTYAHFCGSFVVATA